MVKHGKMMEKCCKTQITKSCDDFSGNTFFVFFGRKVKMTEEFVKQMYTFKITPEVDDHHF